ncbi:MAG: hypothetical protein K2N05_00485 [Muribaculaceae bacterium]|nr:hypothetical protein [Muribaculaceae bacterium]
MKSKLSLCLTLALLVLSSCKVQQIPAPAYQNITLDSEPRGAKVVFQGRVICESTPAEVSVPLTYNVDQTGFKTPGKRDQKTAEMNSLKFDFILPGYETASESIIPDVNVWPFKYPDAVFHQFKRSEILNGVTLKEERVSRENAGETQMEKSVIRWFFDSDPRGARIFWRVISGVPSEVKNTNETYLTSTPYEETRGFNIPGLTYANSNDVTIEIKVTKKGYMDQVKRYNVRQALDQQEISGFFELVPKDE